ncbi:siderophore-interacting protein [Shewanella sp. KJ2020]|uniref:siderophore-interacting protein n=1 Tax=Shewanella sp. KJ2020 TaxID=2919172 RepID=UPI0020A7A8A2|nr:siderophore-interacting protein [Shewanella sp. KJ2020]MCP3129241.1 siderophore-interacting protein [Shewanella sp. KJ2020]
MNKPAPRELEVIRSTYITPHMLRITLGGAGLAGFPVDQESAYIKLLFPQAGERPLMRTYTIRQQRDDEIDVDFVLHDTDGPASSWAKTAQVGELIQIGGPGLKKLINFEADWFLLAGDMTALPAISVNLAKLPNNAVGYAVIEVLSEADIQPLAHPSNVQLHWVINPEGKPLAERIAQLPKLEGQGAVWLACEFSSMRALRKLLKQTYDLPKSHFYTSSYWKIGCNEGEHKLVKQEDEQLENGTQ